MKKNKEIKNKISAFFKSIYTKLFEINDTPQKIALGLGLGVFLGIIPGTGPIAALFMAWILRLNQASALLGSLLTNTWLSIVTLLISIKVGSMLMGLNWQKVQQDWFLFLNQSNWLNLFKISVIKIIFPVLVGYFIVAICLGFVVYLITVVILSRIRYENQNRGNISG